MRRGCGGGCKGVLKQGIIIPPLRYVRVVSSFTRNYTPLRTLNVTLITRS